MKRLDRYFIQQLFLIGLFAILMFTLLWLAPETMFKVIQGIATHQLTLLQGLEYLLYQIPMVLSYCLPIAALFASVFFFRQLSLSGELVAVLSSGVSFQRLLLPVGLIGILFSGFFFLTQEELIPWSAISLRHFNAQTHFDEDTEVTPQVTFVEKSPSGRMVKFLLISPQAKEAQNKFIFLFYEGRGDDTRISKIITATDGHWQARQGQWVLKDGVQYDLNDQGIYRQIQAFQERPIKTSAVAQALLSFPTGNPAEFRLKQLERYVRLLKQGQQTEDAKFYEVRLYQRYFLTLVPLLFALLGTAMGVERSRAKRNMGLTYTAVLLLFYNVTIPVFTTLGSIGLMRPWLAALMPLLLATFGGIAIIQVRRSEG